MVVSFTFFYTDVMFSQQNYGENLKKVGAQIPGVNRGAPTQKYLTKVQRRITLPGALFLGIVAVLGYLINLVLESSWHRSISHPPPPFSWSLRQVCSSLLAWCAIHS